MERKKFNKRILIIIMLAVVILAASLTVFLVSSGAKEGYRTICVIEVSGNVSVVKDGIEYSAYEGMMLQEGHEIVTAGNSYVRMVLDNDKYVKLEAGSKVVFEKLGMIGSGKTHLNLQRGCLTSEIVNPLDEDDEFIINTPNAVLAVRGTFFRVDLNHTNHGEIMADVMTYGGQVASKRVLPDGNIIEEEVLINSGYKTTINMTEKDTYYVVEDNSELSTVQIDIDDITDEDMIDIFYSAKNGHELFVSADEAKSYIEERELNIEEYKSVYDKAKEVIIELENNNKSNSTKVDVTPDDSKPIIMHKEENDKIDTDKSQSTILVTDGDAHVHIEETVITEPTCVDAGKITVMCKECDKVLSETETEALGHTYTMWEQIVLPTCEKNGVNERGCSNCDYIETMNIDKLTHEYAEEYTVDKEATCMENGVKSRHCTRVGCTSIVDETEISAIGHKEVDGETAECHKKCDICDKVISDAKGHTYTLETIQATCTDDGSKTYTCDCGYKYAENMSALGHTEVYVGTKDCHKKCSVCGAITEKEHSYKVDVISEATCTTEGSKKYACSCGYSYTEKLNALGHTEVNGGSIDCHTKCDICGETLVYGTEHNYTVETTEATCMSAGRKTYTCDCGYSYSEGIAALGHTEVNGASKDCHTKCGTCKEVLVDGSGHTLDTAIQTYPTCTEQGEQHVSCLCGYDYNESIAPTGHTEVYGGIEECHIMCSICFETLSDEHILTENITAIPTCLDYGKKDLVCDCGYGYTEEIPALNHSEVFGGEEGVHIKCETCGETLSDENGHEFHYDVVIQPTCTTPGNQHVSCVCGYNNNESMDALGHIEVDGGTLDSHTKCDTCGEVLNDVHTYTITVPVGATCTTSGNTHYSCDCGFEKDEEIPATGHEKEDENADVTTCKHCGKNWVDINSNVFPDANFLNYVQQYDTDNDNYLIGSEIMDITSIDIAGTESMDGGYTNLSGIENFTELEALNCSYNSGITNLNLLGLEELSMLNIEQCTGLTSLDVGGTSIGTLDLTTNTSLQTLYAYGSAIETIDATDVSTLTTVDVANSGALMTLKLKNTGITYIDLSGTRTVYLDVSGTQITYFGNLGVDRVADTLAILDISNTAIDSIDLVGLRLDELTELYADNAYIDGYDLYNMISIDPNYNKLQVISLKDNTEITGIDVSACLQLKTLDVSGTNMTELDLTNNDKLENLYVNNIVGMTELNLEGHTLLKNLQITNNVDLEVLDVSDSGLEYIDASTNRKLITIDISNCTDFATFSMNDGLTQSYAVETINISGCTLLSQFVIDYCPNLTSLDFSTTTNLSYVSVEGCTGLTGELDLSGNSTLQTVTMQGCTGITTLNLTGDTSITNVYLNDVTTDSGIINIIISGTNLTESNFITNGTVTIDLFSW